MARSISLPVAKIDWAPLAAILAPPVVFALLVMIPGLPHPAILKFAKENWGSIASTWGLGISIYVLFVAKGARKAAQAAIAAERGRTVLEELEDAAERNSHIGLFARNRKWDLVQLRAEEVMTNCRTIVARWGDGEVLKESKNKLLMVATLMRSIVEEAGKDNASAESIFKAQLNASEKLSAVLGRAHKEQEAGSE
jgi:hypothetical protein